MIAAMVGIDQRTTMDMDTTLRGLPLTESSILEAIREICAMQLDDETTLAVDYIEPIREDDEYGGFRVAILATFESIITPLKLDITTGDKITPDAVRFTLHSIFNEKGIEVWAYNAETILAEKVETILRRSVLNTRPRDFYDVYLIMHTLPDAVNRQTFDNALAATCEKRRSSEILKERLRILQSIQSDSVMRQRWERYRKEYYYASMVSFDSVIALLKQLTSLK